jgi:hypothetical protein
VLPSSSRYVSESLANVEGRAHVDVSHSRPRDQGAVRSLKTLDHAHVKPSHQALVGGGDGGWSREVGPAGG